MLTITEFFEFLKTPEAQALTSDDEKLKAAQAWKEKLEKAQAQALEVVFDPVSHVANLKKELEQWHAAKDKHPIERYQAAIKRLTDEIAKHE